MTDERPLILCVDDEKFILDALERSLRDRFHVLRANSVEEAYATMDFNPQISCIVCDQVLGDQNGSLVLEAAAKKIPLASRILISGEIDVQSLEHAINKTQIHKFILKPWDSEQLIINIVEAFKIHKHLVEKEQLKKLSVTDPVTQLTNHRFFQEKLRFEWERHKRHEDSLSLIMVDVDYFKKFNDRFGHPDGDQLLFEVGSTIKSNIPEDASLSRYGGDEFGLILPGLGSPQALAVAEKIRHEIMALNSSFQFPLSISLGIASSPQHASSVEELLISADKSLYQAKRRGRNVAVVGFELTE